MFKCKVFSSFGTDENSEDAINAFFTREQPSEIVSMSQGQSLDEDDELCRTVTIVYKEKNTQQS